MKEIHSLKAHLDTDQPLIVTLGFFDGMHKGHQAIFEKMRSLQKSNQPLLALTFKNHPTTILKPSLPTSLIHPLKQRLGLIKEQNVDYLMLLSFTKEIQNQSADEFVSTLYEAMPFSDLVLGYDATVGKNQEGTYECLALLAKKFGFDLHRIEPVRVENQKVSSTLLRQLIEKGDFKLYEKMTGRPYSLILSVQEGAKLGKKLGYPTYNFSLEQLNHPPQGVYKVFLSYQGKRFLAIANLGVAPTLQNRSEPVLEVHVLDPAYQDTSFDEAEITFDSFIRKECKFDSKEALITQIEADIKSVLT